MSALAPLTPSLRSMSEWGAFQGRPATRKRKLMQAFGNSSARSKARGWSVKRGYLTPETHYLDTSYAGVIPTNGHIFSVNAIAEGNEYNTRTGRTIGGRYLQYDIYIIPPTTSGLFDTGQFMVVLDKAGASNVPTVADVLDTSVCGYGMQFRNIAKNIDRFKILKMIRWKVQNGSPDITYRCTGLVKLKGKIARATFGGTTATIPLTNALYVMNVSLNNTAAAATSAAYYLSARYAFIDL